MGRFAFVMAWWVIAALLCGPLYWVMVDSAWGLRTLDQLTVERQFAVFGFIALITGTLAWILTASRRNAHRIRPTVR